jgi:hypothetical protein
MWLQLAIAAAAAAAAFVAGWQVRDWRADAAELARVQAEQRDTLRRQEAAYGASSRHEARRETLRREIQTVTVEVERVVERPVYRNECLDADGLRLIASAIGTAASASQPGPALPASGATR